MKNIAFVVPYGIEKSGLIVFIKRLLKTLVSFEINPILLTPFIDKETVELRRRFKWETFNNLSDITIWLINNTGQFDVLFWAGFPMRKKEIIEQINLSNVLRAENKKRIVYLWERTGYQIVFPEKEIFQLINQNSMVSIIFLNQSHMREFLSQNPHTKIKLQVIPPGVDTLRKYIPDTFEKKLSIRSKFNLNLTNTIGLILGRFEERKHQIYFCDFWKKYSFKEFDSDLLLVGSSFGKNLPMEKIINEKATSIDSISLITYIDGMDRVQFYQLADYLILTGTIEGEPSVLSEGMACGLPVVATNIAGHTDLVINGKTGYLYNIDSEKQLIDAIRNTTKSKYHNQLLGNNARQVIVRKRDILEVTKQYYQLLSEVY